MPFLKMSKKWGNSPIFFNRNLIGIFFILSLNGSAPTMDNLEPSEQQVKAAYLYNFAKFVEWPESAFQSKTDPIRIGIIGKDPFGPILDQTIKDKEIKGRKFEIKRYKTNPIDQHFHIVYIGSQNSVTEKKTINYYQHLPVLTVGDTNDFALMGGCINFILRQNRILFEINVDASQRSGLRISSRLLRLAILIEEER